MKRFASPALALLLMMPLLPKAQTALEPYLGYSIDVNNKEALSQVHIGLQFPLINKPIYQLLVGLRAGLPASKHNGTDVGYTPDAALSLNSSADYQTKLSSYALVCMNRFKIFSWREKNSLSGFVQVGVAQHRMTVKHSAYNEAYTLLNPHQTMDKMGVFIGGGFQYKRQMGTGHAFAQLDASSPPAVERRKNYHYKMPTLLGLQLGYAFTFNKKK